MLKNLMQQAAAKMLRNTLNQLAHHVEPSCFGDSLAERTRWNPLKSGGSNFRTHKLVSTQRDRMEFRITAGMLLFALAFFLVGVGAAAGTLLSADLYLPLGLFGLIFLAIGGGLLYFSAKPIVFDKRKGFFWKGWKSPDDVTDLHSIKCCARLGEIHALQLIAEQIKDDGSSYSSYELNLVLKDASRINVVDHGSKERIREDAAALAAFLGRPLWDAAELKMFDAAMLASKMEELRKIEAGNPELLDEKTRELLEKLALRLEKMA
ncbi:hypothetical protein [Candidatus Electronema sp. TJ]|uniref:hypothetical protein n=1 Tax=Candidatus Electronema sp. TJ TaxID=3401573 RepID=UPI003AA96A49